MARPAAEVVRGLGGAATRADILGLTTEWALRQACRRGEVQRLSRSRYALPELPPARREAERLHGVLSHESAAAHWLMEPLQPPDKIHVTVGRNHRPVAGRGVALHYADVEDERVTAPLRTVLDCARTLPFGPALAIADSALRRHLIDPDHLLLGAAGVRGPGAKAVRQVAEQADGRSANPFESGLRAIVLQAGLTGFVPQLLVPGPPDRYLDLGDPILRIALEADSFAFHGSRAALRRDCQRYDELVAAGWLVLRFAWEHVMFDAAWVRQVVLGTVQQRRAAAGRARASARKRGRAA